MLRELRRRQGLSQQAVAELLGVSPVTYCRWETRRQRPQPFHIGRLCKLWEVAPTELGLLGEEDEEMKRREFLGGLTAVGSLLLIGQDPFEPPSVEDLEEVARQYGSWYWRLSPASLRPLLQEQQRRLLGAMAQLRDTRQRHRVASLAAQSAVIYGLTSIRQADPVVSEERFGAAGQLAQAAGDRDGEVMALIARRSLFIGPSPVEPRSSNGGYQLLEQAQRLTSRQSPALLRTWLNTCLAEDAGALGWEKLALQYLEDAERSFAQASPDDLAGYYDHWDEARLQGWRASTLLALGKPEEAAPILEYVVQQTPVELVGPRSAVVTDRADAFGRAGEMEQACSVLGEAWETARRDGDWEMMTRTKRVQLRLAERTDCPEVSQLAQLMAS